jgi:hypothetical protein
MVYMTEQDPFCRGDGRAFHNRKEKGQKETKDITKMPETNERLLMAQNRARV